MTAGALVLVDWDTTLAAPPERDLWDLTGSDASLLNYYTAATGTEIDHQALSLYRLWYDLAEVGGYLGWFQGPMKTQRTPRRRGRTSSTSSGPPSDGRPWLEAAGSRPSYRPR